MIQFRIQGREKNHLIQIEHGQPIDILEEMELLGFDHELWMRELLIPDIVRP